MDFVRENLGDSILKYFCKKQKERSLCFELHLRFVFRRIPTDFEREPKIVSGRGENFTRIVLRVGSGDSKEGGGEEKMVKLQ